MQLADWLKLMGNYFKNGFQKRTQTVPLVSASVQMCYVGVSTVNQKPNIDVCACLKGVLIKWYLLAQDFYCSKIENV